MRGPPDPEMRNPAAANGRVNRKSDLSPQDTTKQSRELQAVSLVRRVMGKVKVLGLGERGKRCDRARARLGAA